MSKGIISDKTIDIVQQINDDNEKSSRSIDDDKDTKLIEDALTEVDVQNLSDLRQSFKDLLERNVRMTTYISTLTEIDNLSDFEILKLATSHFRDVDRLFFSFKVNLSLVLSEMMRQDKKNT
jgi:hypothetical protein